MTGLKGGRPLGVARKGNEIASPQRGSPHRSAALTHGRAPLRGWRRRRRAGGTALVQLLCRVTKLGWFDTDAHHEIVKDVTKFLSATQVHYRLSLA